MAELPDDFLKQIEIAERVKLAEEARAAEEAAAKPVIDLKAKIGELLVAAEYTASRAFGSDVDLGNWEANRVKMVMSDPAPIQRGWFRRNLPPAVIKLGDGINIVGGQPFKHGFQGYDDEGARTGLTLRNNGALYRHQDPTGAHVISRVEATDNFVIVGGPSFSAEAELEIIDSGMAGLARILIAAGHTAQ